MRRVLWFRQERCLACRGCELACSAVHPGERRRVVVASGPDGVEALRCEQCGEPLCAFACKSGAIRRDLDGRVVLDPERCVGCFMCLMVCPSGVRPDPARDRVVRCDVCAGREIPACVAACPTGALGAREEPDGQPRSDFRGHVVVVGSSAAGIAACEAAREHAPDCRITLVTADAQPQYSRPLLAYVLAGRIPREQVNWRAEGFLDELRVRVLYARAVGLEPGALVLQDGDRVPFDRLIVATGARGAAVSIPGADLPHVSMLRDLEDLDRIEALAGPGRSAVVLGGGNVGLQACEALMERGTRVAVVAKSRQLLSQMVDAEAARRVGALFAAHGLRVCTGCEAVRIHENGVELDTGEVLPADVVIVGKGITPNVEWLRGAGVGIGRGITVDLCGRTSMPGIFAAGDCAETTAVSGLWPVAYEMGRAAGSTAVGIERPSAGALRMNASRFFGTPLVSIGEVRGAGEEVLECSAAVYRKLVLQGGRLAGALLYGDISGAGSLFRLYRAGSELNVEDYR